MHTYKTNKTLHGYINISILISSTTILPVSLQKPQKMWSPALGTDLKVRVQHVSKPGRWYSWGLHGLSTDGTQKMSCIGLTTYGLTVKIFSTPFNSQEWNGNNYLLSFGFLSVRHKYWGRLEKVWSWNEDFLGAQLPNGEKKIKMISLFLLLTGVTIHKRDF